MVTFLLFNVNGNPASLVLALIKRGMQGACPLWRGLSGFGAGRLSSRTVLCQQTILLTDVPAGD